MQHVVKQMKKDPSKSIGVVALSQRQQTAIRNEKDLILRDNPDLHELFEGEDIQNKFFIKNLESVQGDQRDIIYISVGYGKDHNGKLTMTFGPINKEGGERRLNVLISRAKDKVNVFSSITGDDFDLTKTNSLGVKYLKEYLDYAKSGGDISTIYNALELGNDFDVDNPFERSVYEQLRLEGIDCTPQVGQSGYKIDFGIIDPNDKSKYILALECDGASYHSSATARDRDRLRQDVLENLGWKFHRIWSTDWFDNHKREMDKLKEAISSAQLGKKIKQVDVELEYEDLDTSIQSNNAPNILPYNCYPIRSFGSQEDFYEIADSTYKSYKERFDSFILDIIKIESPIHIKQLALRAIEHYNMRKVGARISRIFERKIKRLQYQNKIKVKGDFIYQKRQKIDFIRTRVNTSMDDNILFISPDEIKNAIEYILKKEFFIPKEELIVQIRKLLGYEHTGPRIQKYLKEIKDKLDGKFIKLDGDDYKLK